MAKLKSLPSELFQMIATCGILRRSDLASLTLTNKQLYFAINKILYKTFGSPVAIEFAVKNSTIGTLEAALSFGLDIHYDGDEPLHQACRGDRIEVIKWLLNHGSSVDTELISGISGTSADVSRSPLFSALVVGSEDAALLLLKLGATPRFTFRSDYHNHKGYMCYHVARRAYYYTALHIAVDKGMLRVMEFLIHEHIQPIDENVHGYPFHGYPFHGYPSVLVFSIGQHSPNRLSTLKKLIELGANVNVETYNGGSPFILALEYGYYDYAEALLDAGVMINSRSTNPRIKHPIHACISGSRHDFLGGCAMLSRLIEAGADLEKSYLGGYTPLGQAVVDGHCKMVSHLLSLGVRVDGQDSSGRTPLDRFVDHASHDYGQFPEKVLALLHGGARMDTPLFDGRTLLEWIIQDWDIHEFIPRPSSTDLLEQLLAAATSAMLNKKHLDELLFIFFEPRYYKECIILLYHGATLKLYDEAYSAARDMISAYEHHQPRDPVNHFIYFQMIAHAGLPAEKFDELIAYAREVGDIDSNRALLGIN
ncbi:ankyrin repeat-containing domain protein [Daldinia decipiens]|uniref:ankyrin repeat-containing domain protein n=1 Tax=Daldinia decipiens TaxID=326647 RepID=UPI0020C41F8C|nr:ankyrin repeat-containing domain protein [Daldinia decipiens]KAI1659681.1 ankyrin repeat-containing domain protein [Daldinia decipiens]